MDKHIKFLPGNQRKFLVKVARKSNMTTDQLAGLAGVVPRSFRDWKREKINMTLKAADLLSSRFHIPLPENRSVLINRWIRKRKRSCQKGGKALFRKYGSPATTEGRKKGGLKAIQIMRKKGIIPHRKKYCFPINYNSDLAEYIGILLGDGGLTPGQVFITLNYIADREYISYVMSLCKRLFKVTPGCYKRKESNAYVIYLCGIDLINFLVNIGLKTGNKVKNQVGVPSWIKLNNDFKIACLRGLMDTDGGIFTHNYNVNGKLYKYRKICFSNRSLPLLFFVKDTLEELGLTPKLANKIETKHVWLYNNNEVKEYLKLVGTHNSRLNKE